MSSLDHLLEALEPNRIQELNNELKDLRAIKEWAIEQLGLDYKPGDRVVIVHPKPSQTMGGWAHYSEALAVGQTGIAGDLHFDSYRKRWSMLVGMDRAWSVSEDGTKRFWGGPAHLTPEGYEAPSRYDQEHYPQGKVKHFSMDPAWVKKCQPEPEPEDEEKPMSEVVRIRLYETADGDAAAIDGSWVNASEWAELDALADRLKRHAAELRERYQDED